MGGPKTEPAGGLKHVLGRWESSGGRWQVVDERVEWLTVALFARDGDHRPTQVTGARTSALQTYLAGRSTSHDAAGQAGGRPAVAKGQR